jgi:hypothetical protein
MSSKQTVSSAAGRTIQVSRKNRDGSPRVKGCQSNLSQRPGAVWIDAALDILPVRVNSWMALSSTPKTVHETTRNNTMISCGMHDPLVVFFVLS